MNRRRALIRCVRPPARRGEERSFRLFCSHGKHVGDEMCNPMGKGLRLARAGASNHQQRRGRRRRFGAYAMLDGAALFLVQISQIFVGYDCLLVVSRSGLRTITDSVAEVMSGRAVCWKGAPAELFRVSG